MGLVRVLAADPGKAGAIAILEDRKIVSIVKMPVFKVKRQTVYDLAWIEDIFRASQADLVAIEAVTRPASLVANRWFMHGLAAGLGIPVKTVVPITWKRYHGAQDASKETTRNIAHTLCPEYGFDKLNKGQDGYWEAYLIGLYALEAHTAQA